MTSRLQAAKGTTADLISTTSDLKAKTKTVRHPFTFPSSRLDLETHWPANERDDFLRQVQMRQELIDAFLQRYGLTAEEKGEGLAFCVMRASRRGVRC